MGLKQDIVVVNEYTVPLPGGGGSRGGTPGDYVTRYMARDGAVETLAPIKRQRTDDFILRYMARRSAVESLDVKTVDQLKGRMSAVQGLGGMAFGYGSLSLSHEELVAASQDIQAKFEQGHTVLKTVLSMDQDYLIRHGIVKEGFKVDRPGDYRGHVDQMKLRMAITHGVERMGRAMYDDLRWIAVVQVDTEHVHAHLAMVDAGKGTMMPDGTQRGKIDDRAKSLVRRGIDSWLDDHGKVAHLSSAVGYERRNVTAFVKQWAHQQALRESLPQFLLATLPQDRRLWRLDTNNAAMAKPNRIVKEIVEEVLSRPESPMSEAMAKVHDYANHRREQEGLTPTQWARLVATGRDGIVERGVNAVYATLRQLPSDALRVRTPMLDVMGMDYAELTARAAGANRENEDDLVGFSFRLRSYSARLKEHTGSRQESLDNARRWEAADQAGVAAPASRALYLWYLEEEQYQARCAAKYRHFLPFPQENDWQAKWDSIHDYGERMLSLESMSKDASLKRTKDLDEAERIGRRIYGQSGGHLVAAGDEASRERLERRIEAMRVEHARRIEDLRAELATAGLVLRVETTADGRTSAGVSDGAEYPFEEVKGLDMHRMRYDFSRDVEIGASTRTTFIEAARRRAEALEGAVAYLEDTGQDVVLSRLPVDDVRQMVSLAGRLQADPQAMLPSQVAALAAHQRHRRSASVRLGTGLADQVSAGIVDQIRSVEPEQVIDPNVALG